MPICELLQILGANMFGNYILLRYEAEKAAAGN